MQKRHRRAKDRRSEQWKRWFRRRRSDVADKLTATKRWFKFVVLGLAVFCFALLLFSPILHVRAIRVIRTEGRVDLPKVLSSLSSLYDRHILLVSARDVSAQVREVVPDASEVTVSKNYPSELVVRITLLPLVAKAIIDPPETAGTGSLALVPVGTGSQLQKPKSALFLTKNGLLVSAPPPPPAEVLPTVHIVDWSVRPVPVQALVDTDVLDRMNRAEQALSLEFGQRIRSRTIFLRAREFHLDTPTVSFWFDMRSPLEGELSRLRTFLKSVKLPDVKKYVDLRLMGRVIYK